VAESLDDFLFGGRWECRCHERRRAALFSRRRERRG
jgi:hypothetical protein